MCHTYCHRLAVLYWNHEDCWVELCPLAAGPHGRCDDCRHRQADRCGLTQAPLPASGGCCHWNVDPKIGWQAITRETLRPLQLGITENVVEVLDSLDVPYRLDESGTIWLDVDSLQLPFTYGVGAEHLPAETLDWSDWLSRWTAVGRTT